MRTYKPLSTISYNTRPFLLVTLDALKSQGIIKSWIFVEHKGDKRKGTKDHYHLYVEPCKTIDTDSKDWCDRFIQPVKGGVPLNVMQWTKSKWQDWCLYAQHNKEYLTAKKELDKSEYDLPKDRFRASDEWLIDEAFAMDTFEYITPIERIIWCYTHGLDKYEAMKKCRIPYASMVSFCNIYAELKKQEQDTYEERYTLKFFAEPEKHGLLHHIYYRDNVTSELLTEEEYEIRKKEYLNNEKRT